MLTALLIAVLVLVIGALIVFVDTTQSPLPQTSGVAEVPGLRAQVEILRDARGVPHIYASNTHDLFYAQGYVQAQDRWWQMERMLLVNRFDCVLALIPLPLLPNADA
ncbi:MAG: penicillin acylase family protein, partial [Chloroflexi bacterium]|nr:penicillin acylase family protein [Chloroflexota bacterium]